MNPWKEMHDTFVPHVGNDYKPHFFRLKSVLIMIVTVLVLGIGAIAIQKTLIERTDYLAAVISSAIVNLTNTDRGVNNLTYLAVNPVLERAAQMKAEDMAKKSYFAHTSPEGVTPWHWFKQAGYAFAYAGENLAIRFSDSMDVQRAWMNSPTHRANILNSHFTEIGIGIAEGMYEGQKTTFVVQMFGTPSAKQKYPSFLATSATTSAPTTTPVVLEASASTTPEAPRPATTTPVAVKGATEEASAAPAGPESEPEVIIEDETFIAVKNEVATTSVYEAEAPQLGDTLIQKLVTSPKSVVGAIYLVLATIVGIALIVMIVVEFRRQHPQNVALGVLIILLMVVLLYVAEVLVPGSLLIR